MQQFEKLKVNLIPESIYMKDECGLKKHTDIYIYIHIHIHIYIYIYILHIYYIYMYIIYIYIYVYIYIYLLKLFTLVYALDCNVSWNYKHKD